MRTLHTLAALSALAIFSPGFAQKKPLDHSVYDSWKSVQGSQLSRDGKWILYRIAPQEGDAVAEVKRLSDGKTYTIPRGSSVQFSNDGKYVVATVVPKFAEAREARLKKAKPEDQPKNALAILDLQSGETKTMEKVSTFSIADEDAGFIAYRPEPPKPEPAKPGEAKPAETKKDDKPTKKPEHRAGDPLIVRNLATGQEQRLEDVVQFRFTKDGKVLVYTLSTKDGAGDGIYWHDLATNKRTTIASGLGRYSRVAFDDKASRVVFLSDNDDYAAKKPSQALYAFTPATGKTQLVVKEGTPGIEKGFWIPETATIRLSNNGNRVFFATQAKPVEEKKDETPDEDKVSIDIWHWQDVQLQPQQLLRRAADAARTFEAVAHLDTMKVVQLETPDTGSVTVADRGDSDIALVVDAKPYERESITGDMNHRDYHLMNVRTGERKPLMIRTPMGISLSPTGKFAYGYHPVNKEFTFIDIATGTSSVLKDIKVPIWDELTDVPTFPSPYGMGGWTEGEKRVLLYDRYDIWSVDPTGKTPSVNVTDGFGRNWQIQLRVVDLNPDERFVKPNQPLYLSAFDERSKASGFYRDRLDREVRPEKVLMEDRKLSNPTVAKAGETIMFTRQSFVESPDVWVADNLNFANPRKISDANPQQKEYNWGTSEIVQWTSNDGTPLQGLLIKPEDFDPGKKYPMIAYFYERSSDELHTYRSPAPSASIINWPYFASNGYVIFIPDIPYKEGYPGESAMSAIMPGIQSVVSRGYIDPKKIGLDGQSWGGYQIAYMVTETNLFACAFAGAPVSNMFSAYGGIRWESGLVRQFQYERGQSRIAGTPWDKPLRYLENSPLFFADKVQTPLLIMSNDKDGAVPWYQGIEYFTALRRLGKPTWMLNYNDEAHNLVQRKNRKDLSIRKSQFFDHYLKGAPMPLWMSQGIPATEKGKTLGLEYQKKQ